jgi:hypothetical protein
MQITQGGMCRRPVADRTSVFRNFAYAPAGTPPLIRCLGLEDLGR